MLRPCVRALAVITGVALLDVCVAGEPPCTTCPTPVEKTFCTNKVQLYEEQDLTTIPRLNVREVTTRVPTMGVEIDYKEEKRCTTVMVVKPREEERLVTTVTKVPETTVDPCTGKTCITYREVPVCKTVKVQVFDTVPETREYTVRVPVLKPVETAVDVTRLTVDLTTTAATCTRLRMVETPAKLTIPETTCPLELPPLPCKDCR